MRQNHKPTQRKIEVTHFWNEFPISNAMKKKIEENFQQIKK